ncbi:sugar diacid recognition domain-containing protein [Spirillospora sp. NPDC029432]|uniref:sugar diacid recognition domain-containing protein n=1 Tax=Spirillospora sp. NPDC029432 TaxID=3154599 RepID=UPI0034542988
MIAGTDAQAIVDEIMRRLGRNVNLMDGRGVIIASGDRDRVGEEHDGAVRVLRSGEPVAVTGAEARSMRGTRAGVNLPVRIGAEIAGVVGVTGEPAEVGDLAGAVALMTELMITQQEMRAESEWRARTRDQIVADLVAGHLTAAQWRRRLRLAGARPAAPFALFALRPGLDGPGDATGAAALLYRRLGAGGEEQVLAAVDVTGTLWAVAGAAAPASLRGRLREMRRELPGACLLDAGTAADFGALLENVRRGRLALRRRTLPPETTLRDQEVSVLLAELPGEVAGAAGRRILGELPADLRRTLRTYFAHDRHVAAAAGELNVHRNTLVYRLGRIAELTGRDPRLFDDAVALQAALYLADLG